MQSRSLLCPGSPGGSCSVSGFSNIIPTSVINYINWLLNIKPSVQSCESNLVLMLYVLIHYEIWLIDTTLFRIFSSRFIHVIRLFSVLCLCGLWYQDYTSFTKWVRKCFTFFSKLKNILEVLNYLYLECFIELSIKNSFLNFINYCHLFSKYRTTKDLQFLLCCFLECTGVHHRSHLTSQFLLLEPTVWYFLSLLQVSV